ncbi:MAG: SDR family oxidoreductase [Pseudomonadota bacterium]
MTGVAVVTGAASGIGRAIAEGLASRGYQLVLCDVDREGLNELGDALETESSIFVANLASPHNIANLAQQTLFRFGKADLVFANAGVGAPGRLTKASPDLFDTVFDINVKSQWLTGQVFARHWIDQGQAGRICLTASEHSLGFQHAGAGLYTASKHAILGLADVWRHELPDSISLSVLCPGIVKTGFFDQSQVEGAPKPGQEARAVSERVMAHGMSPFEVAEAAIRGTLNGDFLIVTHRVARDGALKRWQDIEAAYEAQVPSDGEDDDKYRVSSIIAKVTRDLKSGS